MVRTHQPPQAADLDRVVETFNGLMHRLMATHSPELNAIDLTMSQTKALYLVMASGALRMSEFAHRLGVTNSTATGLVDRLVELDLLERREDPSDRRHVVVTPTPQAEEMVDHFRELNSNRMREMLIHLDRADLDTVERSLHILTAALEARATTSIDHTGVEDVGRSVTNAVGDRS